MNLSTLSAYADPIRLAIAMPIFVGLMWFAVKDPFPIVWAIVSLFLSGLAADGILFFWRVVLAMRLGWRGRRLR